MPSTTLFTGRRHLRGRMFVPCARLEVPLDWNRTDGEGHRVAIALTKLPAKVPVTDPRYGGPVLINPGGPGGSGVYLVLREGKLIQRIIDSQASVSSSDTSSSPDGGAKYFDVIGFDPRGVNNTTPVFSCFPDAFSRQVWGLESHAEGLLGSSENSFANLWARSQALSHGCSRMAASGEGAETELSQFMNTSPVARDMLEMIERHGEWRALEAKALVTGHAPWFRDDTSRKIPSYDRDSVLERTKWRKGQEKLLYMGFSYGTILGATFAAMYPDRIGRAVIDGVGDADDYYRGGWLTNLNDSDLILDQFCKYCHEAGPGRCALYTGKSSDDIKSFFESIVASMKGNPLAVEASRTRGADIITFTDVKALIKDALYKPLDRFSMMAELLADISRGNGTPFADHKSTQRTISCSTPEVGGEGKVYPETCGIPQDARFEVPAAILCSDGESLAGMTPESYKGYWQILQNQSSLIGDSWAHIKMPCTGWTIRPKWRFNGPISGNTSHPLLIIGNTFDPVTPLGNAHKAAQSFNGSVVLQQDSEGSFTNGFLLSMGIPDSIALLVHRQCVPQSTSGATFRPASFLAPVRSVMSMKNPSSAQHQTNPR
ncbi:MAG: hypothetical protein M1837_006540 [Sclerophora amabilis]|nr:MAG: hypothetical protein M1837_006540 [Sclerophora amabilis]